MSLLKSVLEPSLFEQSQPGARAMSVPAAGVPAQEQEALETLLPGHFLRKTPPRLPECSQLDVLRHFIRLSQLNHCIDTGFYPLGSCTMKFNPKICDATGSLPGFSRLHPLAPEHLSQGALEVIYRLQTLLCDITGFDQVTLQPAAGAQGELVGMMLIKKYFETHGQPQRTQVIIPESAHGTNPASAAMCGFEVLEIPANPHGLVNMEALKAVLSANSNTIAAMMTTNPSTLGLFESEILTISDWVHQAGGFMYYDGANLNAVMGQAKPRAMGFDVMHINTHKTFATPHGGGGPGSGPVAVTEQLAPFLPVPRIVFNGTVFDGAQYALDDHAPHTIGRVKLFYGNFEMMIRALTYILAYGAQGLAQVSSDAVLNANYVLSQLKDVYDVAYDRLCKHEFVLTSKRQKQADKGLNTMAIAKRLMDYGFHPPTVYFPLIVPEAMMIEPTETESKATLDRFIAAMRAIAAECETQPEVVLTAPHSTPVARVDEVTAARQLNLNALKATP